MTQLSRPFELQFITSNLRKITLTKSKDLGNIIIIENTTLWFASGVFALYGSIFDVELKNWSPESIYRMKDNTELQETWTWKAMKPLLNDKLCFILTIQKPCGDKLMIDFFFPWQDEGSWRYRFFLSQRKVQSWSEFLP